LCQLAACIMNTTDELATRISKGDIAVMQTLDLGLFWHDLCRYKVWAGVGVGQNVPACVWGECDFHVNWLHYITNTSYALATEWWFWYQPATSPFNTKHTKVCVRVNITTILQRRKQAAKEQKVNSMEVTGNV